MATATCDVCSGLLEKINSSLLPDYQTEIDLSGINLNLPDHLRHMKLIACGQVVRCSLCGLEDDFYSQKMFEHLAYIRMFQTFPHGQTLKLLRDFFDISRQWLVNRIGYESIQTIYRYEHNKTQMPKYAKKALIEAFIYHVKVNNSVKQWYFDEEDWYGETIELTEDNKVIVPFPIQLCLIPHNCVDRSFARMKFNAV